MMAVSGRGFHEADVSSTSTPLRVSPVRGEFINSAGADALSTKIGTSADVEFCPDANFS